jgi:hypothetical protein
MSSRNSSIGWILEITPHKVKVTNLNSPYITCQKKKKKSSSSHYFILFYLTMTNLRTIKTLLHQPNEIKLLDILFSLNDG